MKIFLTLLFSTFFFSLNIFGKDPKPAPPITVLDAADYGEFLAESTFVSRLFVGEITAMDGSKVTVSLGGETIDLALTAFFDETFEVGQKVVVGECFKRKDHQVVTPVIKVLFHHLASKSDPFAVLQPYSPCEVGLYFYM